MTFDLAFERLLGHEGRLSLDPNDRGNWTSGVIGVGELRGSFMGISAMSYPHLDIRNLTVEQVKAIYRRDFWDRVGADELQDGVAYQAFDFAVNSGIGTAIRKLQLAVGVADDGDWGPISAAAARAMSESDIIMRLNAHRLLFMTALRAWSTQGRGWTRRIAGNLLYGAEDS